MNNLKLKSNLFMVAAIAVCVLLLSGCADVQHIKHCVNGEVCGFWYGLWHGYIAVIAFIINLFTGDTPIYAVNNNGGWYNFGFLIGIGAFGGTCSSSRKKG